MGSGLNIGRFGKEKQSSGALFEYNALGVSILFMVVDLLGGVFSAQSLIFKPKFDTFAAIPYILVVVLDGGVVLLALVLNPIARKRRQYDTRVQDSNAFSVPNPERITMEKMDK
ncbi:hypothetical protein FRC06_010318 [Ceratobasidium sp. 370]|nr:hypothetical protein FRC06_010318 [Ceratobasidium sp. 370]